MDRVQRPYQGPQNVQQVHCRPSAPYPGRVLGPGTEGLRAMPPYVVRQVYPPTQGGRFTSRGPSCTGPFTYFRGWDNWIGEGIYGCGAIGGAAG